MCNLWRHCMSCSAILLLLNKQNIKRSHLIMTLVSHTFSLHFRRLKTALVNADVINFGKEVGKKNSARRPCLGGARRRRKEKTLCSGLQEVEEWQLQKVILFSVHGIQTRPSDPMELEPRTELTDKLSGRGDKRTQELALSASRGDKTKEQ